MKFDLKETFNTICNSINEHKPEIATGAGIALMIGGTVATVVATVKTMRACSAAKEEKLAEIAPDRETYDNLTAEEMQEYDEIENSPLPKKEAAAICWKWWILPVGLIAAGTGSILYSDHEQAKRIAGLMTKVGALAFHAAEAKDYKEAAKEILGEKKEKEIDDEAARKSVKRREVPANYGSLKRFGNATMLCMDYYSNQLFYADENYLQACVNELNERINDARQNSEEFVELNDWFDILHIDRAGCGNDLTFDVAAGNVRLSDSNENAVKREDGELCWIVRLYNPPRYHRFY